MSRTFFQDFTRDNGLPITVEYAADGSYSPTTYSPMYGADGGDFPEFAILRAWPRTPFSEWLASISNRLWSKSALPWRIAHAVVRGAMRFNDWWRASLTDAERERMEAWIAEHYVDEPDDDFESR
ncbi:MAG: hypothetical protein ACK4UO_06020 [Pseudolabrys sp.]